MLFHITIAAILLLSSSVFSFCPIVKKFRSDRIFAVIKKFDSTITLYDEIKVETLNGISFHDIKSDIQRLINESGITEGTVTVNSKHTTTAITINEMEARLVDDSRQFLLKLCPPG